MFYSYKLWDISSSTSIHYIIILTIFIVIIIMAITILNVYKPRVTIIIMTVITRVYQFWLSLKK